jgi:hypothetical protein
MNVATPDRTARFSPRSRWSLILGVLSLPLSMVTIGAATGAVAVYLGALALRAPRAEEKAWQAVVGCVAGALALFGVAGYYLGN